MTPPTEEDRARAARMHAYQLDELAKLKAARAPAEEIARCERRVALMRAKQIEVEEAAARARGEL